MNGNQWIHIPVFNIGSLFAYVKVYRNSVMSVDSDILYVLCKIPSLSWTEERIPKLGFSSCFRKYALKDNDRHLSYVKK